MYDPSGANETYFRTSGSLKTPPLLNRVAECNPGTAGSHPATPRGKRPPEGEESNTHTHTTVKRRRKIPRMLYEPIRPTEVVSTSVPLKLQENEFSFFLLGLG